MKRNNKKLILITMIIFILLLSGCKNIRFNTTKGTEDSDSKTELQEIVENDTNDKKSDITLVDETEENKEETTKKDDPTPTLIQPADNTELLVYTVNSNAEKETVTALIPMNEEITPQLIIDTVVASLADNSLKIKINKVTTEGDTVIVNFDKNQPFFDGVGGGYETAILDAIALSLIDNLDDFKKVIYRMDEEAYVSGHIELGIDEVYLEKK